MLALAARLVRKVGDLITGAAAAGQHLATLAIDTNKPNPRQQPTHGSLIPTHPYT